MLIQCPECDSDVSSSAKVCPTCGRPSPILPLKAYVFLQGVHFFMHLGICVLISWALIYLIANLI